LTRPCPVLEGAAVQVQHAGHELGLLVRGDAHGGHRTHERDDVLGVCRCGIA
jgi:hypothetical protein